jgi:hypothetical protein
MNQPWRKMSHIEAAIDKLEKILDQHICFSRRDELREVLSLLREELALRSLDANQAKTSDEANKKTMHEASGAVSQDCKRLDLSPF